VAGLETEIGFSEAFGAMAALVGDGRRVVDAFFL
jgi:hypothetical protein